MTSRFPGYPDPSHPARAQRRVDAAPEPGAQGVGLHRPCLPAVSPAACPQAGTAQPRARRWEWIVGAVALELLSSSATSSPGARSSTGTGCSPPTAGAHGPRLERPGRSSAAGCSCRADHLPSIGVGAWILRHFGMPAKTIAERQFNLGFLNTAVDALALVLFGVGLAVGIFHGRAIPCSPGSRQAWPPSGSPLRAARQAWNRARSLA